MSGHVTEWISAYHDGELHGARLHQVESHLQDCAACQAELEGLSNLSTLLDENPAAPHRTAPDRFVAQVRLQLPPHAPPAEMRAPKTGWLLIPLGLISAWAFLQAVLVVSWVLLIVVPLSGTAPGETLVELFALSISLTVVLAVLLGSWLAGWWVTSRSRMTAPASMDAST